LVGGLVQANADADVVEDGAKGGTVVTEAMQFLGRERSE
jgi:hypothetical protein